MRSTAPFPATDDLLIAVVVLVPIPIFTFRSELIGPVLVLRPIVVFPMLAVVKFFLEMSIGFFLVLRITLVLEKRRMQSGGTFFRERRGWFWAEINR